MGITSSATPLQRAYCQQLNRYYEPTNFYLSAPTTQLQVGDLVTVSVLYRNLIQVNSVEHRREALVTVGTCLRGPTVEANENYTCTCCTRTWGSDYSLRFEPVRTDQLKEFCEVVSWSIPG
jgi:hypothetical protein